VLPIFFKECTKQISWGQNGKGEIFVWFVFMNKPTKCGWCRLFSCITFRYLFRLFGPPLHSHPPPPYLLFISVVIQGGSFSFIHRLICNSSFTPPRFVPFFFTAHVLLNPPSIITRYSFCETSGVCFDYTDLQRWSVRGQHWAQWAAPPPPLC